MSTLNPFDLLGDDDNDDPSHLIAAHQKKIAEKTPQSPSVAAKLPSKPLPPAQAVKEAKESKSAGARGGAARGGAVRGRGGRGNWNRDSENGGGERFSGNYGVSYGGGGGEEGIRERDRGPRQPYRGGGRRGGYGGRGENGNGDAGGELERPQRRVYERRSGTGHGNEMKREGAGRGNWGTPTDEIAAQDKEGNANGDDNVNAAVTEKQEEQEVVPSDEVNKEGETKEAEEKEEDKELTLEEYEKIREEKRKALVAMKSEERKVEIDKELQSMQQLSSKKANEEIFVKLGSDKDSGKKKEAERDEKNKKSMTINEFFKPADGEKYYTPGGRGRGRGRGDRGGSRGGYGGRGSFTSAPAPSIEDPGHFPTLVGK